MIGTTFQAGLSLSLLVTYAHKMSFMILLSKGSKRFIKFCYGGVNVSRNLHFVNDNLNDSFCGIQ